MNLLANVTLLKEHKLYRNLLSSEVVINMNRSARARVCCRTRGPGEGGGTAFTYVEYVDRTDLTSKGG